MQINEARSAEFTVLANTFRGMQSGLLQEFNHLSTTLVTGYSQLEAASRANEHGRRLQQERLLGTACGGGTCEAGGSAAEGSVAQVRPGW